MFFLIVSSLYIKFRLFQESQKPQGPLRRGKAEEEFTSSFSCQAFQLEMMRAVEIEIYLQYLNGGLVPAELPNKFGHWRQRSSF